MYAAIRRASDLVISGTKCSQQDPQPEGQWIPYSSIKRVKSGWYFSKKSLIDFSSVEIPSPFREGSRSSIISMESDYHQMSSSVQAKKCKFSVYFSVLSLDLIP